MEYRVRDILRGVVHPESEENLVDGGMVESIAADEQKITVALRFRKARDPFALKIKARVEQLLKEEFFSSQYLSLAACCLTVLEDYYIYSLYICLIYCSQYIVS